MNKIYKFSVFIVVADGDDNRVLHDQSPTNLTLWSYADNEQDGFKKVLEKAANRYPLPELEIKNSFWKKIPYYKNCLDDKLLYPTTVKYALVPIGVKTPEELISENLVDILSGKEINEMLKNI